MKKILKFIILSAIVMQVFMCINLAADQVHLHVHANSQNNNIGFHQNHSCLGIKGDCRMNFDDHNNIGFYRESSRMESLPVIFVNQYISNQDLLLASASVLKLPFVQSEIGFSPGNDFSPTLRL